MSHIAKAARVGKTAVIWTRTEAEGTFRQFLNVGSATYPLDGLPYCRKENLPSLLSIKPGDEEKWLLDETEAPDYLNFLDTDPEEWEATPQALTIFWQEREYAAFLSQGETYFLNVKCLAPFLREYPNAELLRRTDRGGRHWFAVKNGLLFVGAIYPEGGMKELARTLGALADGYREDP